MSNAFVQVHLPDRSPDFQRNALEPGVPLLDRSQVAARLLRLWLGRFVAEPEWVDALTVQFYVNDDQGRRITPTEMRPVRPEDFAGPLRAELAAFREKLVQVPAKGRTEDAIAKMVRDRLNRLLKDFRPACAEGAFFVYRDAQRKLRLVWCWGYQRSESKLAQPVLCTKPDCRRLYLARGEAEPACPKCHTPMPIYRFPWTKVGLVAACLLLLLSAAGWWRWQTWPRSELEGQIVWSGFGLPVADAEVRIAALKMTVRSDEQGRFRLERLPAGAWEVEVAAEGFQTWRSKQQLARSQHAKVAVELAGDGVFVGQVVDAISRRPVLDAKIQFDGTSQSLLVDKEGRFRHAGCRRGKFAVSVSAIGYPTATHEINLVDDTAPLELAVTGNAILIGRVVSASLEQPISGALITLDGSEQSTRSDAEGWFVFKQAKAGLTRIVAESEGLATAEQEKELASGEERQAQTFKLAGAAKVSGTITRAIDNAPLSSAEVRVAGTKLVAKTDDQGQFQLRGATARLTMFEIVAPGFAPEQRQLELSNSDVTKLDVKLKGDSVVFGRVTDETLNRPLEQADVVLTGSPYRTRTDAKGQYRLEGVPGVPAKIEIRAAGFATRTTDIRPMPKPEVEANFALVGNVTVTGLVVERWSDAPLAKARVAVAGSELAIMTSDEGTFEIKGLRGGTRHELQFTAEGLAPRTEVIEPAEAAQKKLRVVLAGAARQAGLVLSAVDESPVVGAKVALADTENVVTTDDKGQFALEQLKVGLVVLEVSAPNFKSRRREASVSENSKPLSVLLGGDSTAFGQIVDAVTNQPIDDVEVRIDKTVLKASTDAEGRYRIEGAFAGTAKVTAQAEGYPTVSEEIELVAEREHELDLKLQGDAAVTGAVFDDTGKPIAKAVVELAGSEHRVLTGPRGEFQLPSLRAGALRLSVSATNFASESVKETLKLGESKSLGKITLATSRTLRGQLVHALTEEPLANVVVSIPTENVRAKTDAKGEFQFEKLPAKRMTLRVESEGFVSELFEVNPAASEDRAVYCLCPIPKADELFIVLTWQGPGPVEDLDAHLYLADGDKAATHVFVNKPQNDNLQLLRANQNGRGPETIRVHPLKPGRYEFLVHRPMPREATPRATEMRQLSQSAAVVRVYRFGQSEPQTYRIGRNKSANVWQPFALEITNADKIVDHVYKAEHYRQSLPLELRPE